MYEQKQYSINRSYWAVPIGFGVGALLFFLLYFPHDRLQFMRHLHDAFSQYPIVVALFLVANGVVVLALVLLAYTRLRSLLLPMRIEGILQECVLRNEKQDKASITIAVSGRTYKLRFNEEAARVLQGASGRRVRLRVGALRTILFAETIPE
jgi:hypothetical protein